MRLGERLKDLTRLNRRRIDLVLNRIHRQPVLMFGFNSILVALHGMARLKRFVITRLGWLGIDAGSLKRRRLAEFALPEHVPPARIGRPPRVLLVVEESISQCFIYRVRQKMHMLDLAGCEHRWLSWRDIAGSRHHMHFYDVVIFYRVPGFPDVLKAIDYAKALNKIVLYDVDDLIFDRERLEEKFRHTTGQLSSTERIAMLNGAGLYQAALARCPAAIASTPALAEQFAPHVDGQVHVLPNGIDPALEAVAAEPAPPREAGLVDIFYGSGTKTHDKDFELIAGVLERLLAEHPQVRLVVVGHLSLPAELQAFASRVRQLPLLDFESYLYVLSLADISIAPLEAGVFADCKSEIKWLEASLVGVPCVVSATATYVSAIEDGVDGFLADSVDDWYRALQRLISEPELRARLVTQARARARAQYSMAALSPKLMQILEQAVQEAAKAGRVVERSPHKRRIVFVNTVYPPNALGGATVVMQNIIGELQQRFADVYEIEVFTYDLERIEPYGLTEYGWDGVRVTAVSMLPAPNSDWQYRDDEMRELFLDYLASRKPDLIHFHSIQRLTGSLCEAAQSAGVPYIVTVHDAWWLSDHQFLVDEEGRLLPELQRNPIVASASSEDMVKTVARSRYLAKQLGASARILAVSEYQAELYRKNGFPSITVNRNGVAAPELGSATAPDETRLVLGYLGGITHHKGYYFLQRCLEQVQVRNLSLTLVDFDLPAGETRREQWGEVPVLVVPRFPAREVGKFFATIHVLVAPSIWPESFGLITREATLAGRWVVASGAGALAEEVIEDVTGHIFPPGDEGAFRALLERLDRDPERYRSAVDATRVRIASVAGQVQELTEIYAQVLAGQPENDTAADLAMEQNA